MTRPSPSPSPSVRRPQAGLIKSSAPPFIFLLRRRERDLCNVDRSEGARASEEGRKKGRLVKIRGKNDCGREGEEGGPRPEGHFEGEGENQ